MVNVAAICLRSSCYDRIIFDKEVQFSLDPLNHEHLSIINISRYQKLHAKMSVGRRDVLEENHFID